MNKKVRETLAEVLAAMVAGLNTYSKPFSTEMVAAYALAISDLPIVPSDLTDAAQYFLTESDGEFPPAPTFRKEVEAAWNRRMPLIGCRVQECEGLVFVRVPYALDPPEREEFKRKAMAEMGYTFISNDDFQSALATREETAAVMRRVDSGAVLKEIGA